MSWLTERARPLFFIGRLRPQECFKCEQEKFRLEATQMSFMKTNIQPGQDFESLLVWQGNQDSENTCGRIKTARCTTAEQKQDSKSCEFQEKFTRPMAFSLAHFSVIVIFTFEDISFMLIMILALIAIFIEY